MMNILIVYETYSGATQLTAEQLAEILKGRGHEVKLVRAHTANPDDFGASDLILLGSPSWLQDKKDGQPHQYMIEFLEKLKGKTFEGKRFAVFGLGDRDFARFTYAVDIMENAVKNAKGQLIAPPLRIDSFHFKEEESRALIADWAKQLLSPSRPVDSSQ